MTETLTGQVVLHDRVFAGSIHFDTHIKSIEEGKACASHFILPGFIDSHVHGGGGFDTMEGADAIRRLSRFHLRHGTTTLLPTTITRPWEEVLSALRAVTNVMQAEDLDGPRIHGAHLEGPFISPHKLGAQPPFSITPTPEKLADILSTGCVRLVTLAPEIDQAEAAIARLTSAGIIVSIGHTLADYETTHKALCRICECGGVPGGTHLFNAMSPVEGRKPGPATALMCHNTAFAEMIFDTHHVHPANFRLASMVMGDRLLFVTDAMRGTGLPDGPSTLGGQDVFIKNGVVRLPNGSLAGSVLTLDQALRNAVAYGASLPEASRLLSSNPARYLGLKDRGTIEPGKLADLLVLDHELQVREVWVDGRRLHRGA